MKIIKLLGTLLLIITIKSYAIVPVTDENNEIREKMALSVYVARIPTFVDNIAKTKDAMTQLASLNNLINAQQRINNLCNKICSQADRNQLKNYLDNLNSNIIGQFRNYSGLLDNNLSTLKDLSNFISNAPLNTKEITVALQKASEQSLEQIQTTLLQIQTLLVLDSQKRQAEEKVERENTNAIYSGFGKSGL